MTKKEDVKWFNFFRLLMMSVAITLCIFTIGMTLLMIISLKVGYTLGVFAGGFGLVAGSIMYTPLIRFNLFVLINLGQKVNRNNKRRKK